MGKQKKFFSDLLTVLHHKEKDREQRDLYAELMEQNLDGMLVVDQAGIIRYANKAASRLFHRKKAADMEGEKFAFNPFSAEISEIEIAAGGDRLVSVDMQAIPIRWKKETMQLVVFRQRPDHSHVRENLKKTTERLHTLINAAPLGIVTLDNSGCVTLWSKAAERIFEHGEMSLRGQNLVRHLGLEDSRFHNLIDRVLSGTRYTEYELLEKVGDVDICLHISATPLHDAHGMISGAMLLIADFTESKRVQQALWNSTEHLRRVMTHTPLSIFSQDDGLRYTWVLNTFCGLSSEEMLDKTDAELFGDEAAADLVALKRTAMLERTIQRGEVTIQRANRPYCYDITIEPILDAQGALLDVACTALDISVLRSVEVHAAFIAQHDMLTGLPNRSLFRDRLQQVFMLAERNGIERFALLHLGLDRFNEINQSLGHAAGDQLLKEVGRRLQEVCFEADTVARFSGDEFLILAHNSRSSQDVVVLCRKIYAALALPIKVGEHEVFSSAGIGIAVYPNDGDSVDSMLRNADSALHLAKENGCGSFLFFSPDMNSRAMHKLALENDLRHAMERQELMVYYQPQIRLSDNAIVGVEALLRWKHPVRGMIPPDQFIPIAEQTGLIEPIGAWVLQTACRQQVAWCESGLPMLRMAVNLSAVQFQHGDLKQTVIQAISSSGIQPDHLELELTESMLLNKSGNTLQLLQELKAFGVRLSVDDFGTGYSSLSYLKSFPLDILKIDKSFVSGPDVNTENIEIVRAIVAMAHALRLKVIAEGVETDDQLDQLRDFDCDYVQGFFFSRPISAEALTVLLRECTHESDYGQPVPCENA
ncbi:MAG: EAL domain-containing protein [Gallionella sp.]|nr:EAL domain-containing protein [Gallionella sp.]